MLYVLLLRLISRCSVNNMLLSLACLVRHHLRGIDHFKLLMNLLSLLLMHLALTTMEGCGLLLLLMSRSRECFHHNGWSFFPNLLTHNDAVRLLENNAIGRYNGHSTYARWKFTTDRLVVCG